MTSLPRRHTPFTSEEVRNLNDYQTFGIMHPFTCGNQSTHGLLVATESGWYCPDCAYRQTWAWQFMADGSWRETAKMMRDIEE